MATKKFECVVCSKKFARKEHLKGHLRLHTGAKPYKCDICCIRFRNCSNLKEHRRIHTGERPYKCQQCGLKFLQNSHLKKHLRTCLSSSAIKRKEVAKKVTRRRSTQASPSTPKSLKCRLCKMTFNFRTHLKEHLNSHFSGTGMRCEICGEGFSRTAQYKSHKRNHDKEPKLRYQCHICGIYFDQFCKLDMHLNIHVGNKPFRCQFCGISFATGKELIVHQSEHDLGRVHQQMSNYIKCILAEEDTDSELSISGSPGSPSPPATPKSPSARVNYACPFCDRSFTVQRFLDKHIKWHKNGARGDPDQSYTIQSSLKSSSEQSPIELNINLEHSDRKQPFACSVCDVTFLHRHNYLSHLRVHSDSKQKDCRTCGKHFESLEKLNAHRTLHIKRCSKRIRLD